LPKRSQTKKPDRLSRSIFGRVRREPLLPAIQLYLPRRVRALCRLYEGDVERNLRRQPASFGDLTAFMGGLAWAVRRQLDLLVKVSHRWVFLCDWTKSLRELAHLSQYPTFSNHTVSFGFGFRTECLGMSVSAWTDPIILGDVHYTISRGKDVFVQAYLHNLARRLDPVFLPAAMSWRSLNPTDKDGYAPWEMMGADRCKRSPNFIWHDSAKPEEYGALAKSWGN
jgi:hypothetical protein